MAYRKLELPTNLSAQQIKLLSFLDGWDKDLLESTLLELLQKSVIKIIKPSKTNRRISLKVMLQSERDLTVKPFKSTQLQLFSRLENFISTLK